MNGVGQQQTRHQGPGTPGSQMSMFVPQNFSPHENYGQMNHPRPNGRPTFVLPQGPGSGQVQRFGPPPSMPIVRNGISYPATPHNIQPAVLQQNHPNMQQTPGQGEMNVASLYQGAQPQEGAQMDFNTASVIYPNMNSQPHIFQPDGLYGRPVVMFRYPQFMPQVQLFQTRPMSVQVPGNAVQNQMQSYQAQVVVNQQMLQQQQQQASDMRQDASTPQPHHVTQFIPNMGFTPENAPFYYSPHANIGQTTPLMSGQQPLPFPPYLQHAPTQINQSPLQTSLSQGPSKHVINKPYIMYREEYSRSLQQGFQSSGNTLRKEKRAIKIVNPHTNEEVDLSALSKSDVAGTFQKQVKEAADVSTSQTMLDPVTPKMMDVYPDERQHTPSSENVRDDFPMMYSSDQPISLAEPSLADEGHDALVDDHEVQGSEEDVTPRETFSTNLLDLDSLAAADAQTAGTGVEEKQELEEMKSVDYDEGVDEEVSKDVVPTPVHATGGLPEEEIVLEERTEDDEEQNDDKVEEEEEEEDDDKEDDEEDDAGKKHHKRSGKRTPDKREVIGKVDSVESISVGSFTSGVGSDAKISSGSEEKETEISSTETLEEQLVEETSETGEEIVEDEHLKENLISNVPRGDEESTENKLCDDFVEVKLDILKSENDIIAAQQDHAAQQEHAQPPPTNGLHRGRRVYSREFLMNLRDCPEALKKLPTISSDLADIIKPMAPFKRESSVGALSALGMRGSTQPMGYPDFSSLYVRSSSQQNRLPKKPTQKRDYLQQSQQRIINVALNSEVQLHTSEQAWKPSVRNVEAPIGGDDTVLQKLYKKTRSILNKLTPQNFETLVKQIKELPITTEDRLAGCMDLVFEKAISEPNFCVAYAQMAFNICSMKVPSKESPAEFVSFRKLLLNRCQSEFEKDKMDELELEKRQKEIDECESGDRKKMLMLEKADALRRLRRRSLGNIRFIGELFKMKMLTEKIMFDCLTRLMKTDDEDSIECLCWLVRTIGKDVDHAKNKKALDSLFLEISKKSSSKAMSLRMRFMLQDIIELRENNWIPRRIDVNPKTIEQIHKEAQQEELQKQAMINQSPQLINSYPPPIQKGGMDSGSSRMNRYHMGQRGHQMNEEGWTTFLTKNVGRGGNQLLDHSKLRLSKQNVDASDIKLGPCRANTWSQGAGSGSSSGGSQFQSGSRHSSQESEKSSTSNRFAVIGNLGENFDYRQSRPGTFKDPNTAPRIQFPRMLAESGYASLPLHGRTKNADRSSRPNSGSRNASRDSSISREASNRASPIVMAFGGTPAAPPRQPQPMVVPPIVPPVIKESPAFNKDVFKRKTECLVDEYFSILDDKEALLSTQELKMNVTMMSHFVYTIINHVIEKSPKELRHTGHLFSNLICNSAIESKSFTKGLEEALVDAPDLEIDIPKIWDCYTELLSSMLLKSSSFLPPICQAILCLKAAGKAGPLMARCMLRVAENQGCQKTISMWNGAHVSWCDFTDQNLHDFMLENKLESLSAISCDLLRMMNSQADNDVIFLWIDQRIVPHEQKATFIRSLVTAACMASLLVFEGGRFEIKELVFKRYTSLLNRYIDHMPDREAQTLFAVQSLVHSLDHPRNMLNGFFHLVYEVELISEDAFHEWKNSNDPNEQNGKGVATAATRNFFQWLQESVEEEDTS